MAWRLNIRDKTRVDGRNNEEIYCPPHTFPHKLPFSEPIVDEPCHIHGANWRMQHHIPFCRYLECPNYERMMEKYQEYKNIKSK